MYSYALNNPLSNTDPTGLLSQRSDRGFPYHVEQIRDLPGTLAPVAEAALPAGSRPNCIFVAPADTFASDTFGVHRTPEQALIFTQDGVLLVQAGTSSKLPPEAKYFTAGALLYLQSGLLLLYGRIELAGLVDGALTRAVIEYNTVGWGLVQPSMQRLVRLAAGPNKMPVSREGPPAGMESLIRGLPYKFANGVRLYSVQEGETLLGVAFQPALWVPHLVLLRRQLTPQTALTLTDRCVVLIEEERAPTRKSGRYGWVFSYIPLRAITEMQVAPLGTKQELAIRMARGNASAERRLILDDEPARAWRDLWASYHGPRSQES